LFLKPCFSSFSLRKKGIKNEIHSSLWIPLILMREVIIFSSLLIMDCILFLKKAIKKGIFIGAFLMKIVIYKLKKQRI